MAWDIEVKDLGKDSGLRRYAIRVLGNELRSAMGLAGDDVARLRQALLDYARDQLEIDPADQPAFGAEADAAIAERRDAKRRAIENELIDRLQDLADAVGVSVPDWSAITLPQMQNAIKTYYAANPQAATALGMRILFAWCALQDAGGSLTDLPAQKHGN